jgi:predicted amidohydrolase
MPVPVAEGSRQAAHTTVKSLLAQLSPEPGDPAANARKASEIVESTDAELVVFPELYLTGYDLERVGALALEPASGCLASLRAAAARSHTAVLVGFAERRGGGVSNALALIDERGELVAIQRKVQLFGEERGVFEPGEELVVAELAGLSVGPLICFDMEFPELARALARSGAELLVTVAANMEPFYTDHQIASQARALDNRLAHLYCNRCGEEAGFTFVGGSRALRPDGTIEAQAAGGERLLAVDFHPEPADDRVDYLAQLPEGISVRTAANATGGIR